MRLCDLLSDYPIKSRGSNCATAARTGGSMQFEPALRIRRRTVLGVGKVADLVALAKKNPGRLNYASFGNCNGSHLAMEVFKSQTGTQIVHIPYLTPGAAVVDLVAGRVDLAFLSLDSSPHVKAG